MGSGRPLAEESLRPVNVPLNIPTSRRPAKPDVLAERVSVGWVDTNIAVNPQFTFD